MVKELPYRPAVGVMLVNADGLVWVGQRIDSTTDAWQMPQGGLDAGEEPLDGALRELEEETGVSRDRVDVVAEASRELFYDLPVELVGKLWRGKWRGQRQRWFLMRFRGEDADVRIDTAEPEFRAWRWVAPAELPNMIVPFKRDMYRAIVDGFTDHLGPVANPAPSR